MFYVVQWIVRYALLFYVRVGLAIAGFLAFMSHLPDEYALARESSAVAGVVVQPSCDQHNSFSYRFELAGVAYQGVSTSDECGRVNRGDKVLVHYLPKRPQVNMVGDPDEWFDNELVSIGTGALIMPAVLLLIIWAKWRDLRAGRRSDAEFN
ncbi:hypothetical protein [Dyella sp.]|uniref:hypothetical protein n=1 Tax=Dyella sp. TaxID=1869338 RepID=UPI0032168F08